VGARDKTGERCGTKHPSQDSARLEMEQGKVLRGDRGIGGIDNKHPGEWKQGGQKNRWAKNRGGHRGWVGGEDGAQSNLLSQDTKRK